VAGAQTANPPTQFGVDATTQQHVNHVFLAPSMVLWVAATTVAHKVQQH
jgi:hypothetical protein